MEIICVITEWAAAFTENIIALSAVALAAGKKKGHNKYILLRNADRRCDGAVRYKMAVLTVYRNREFRTN